MANNPDLSRYTMGVDELAKKLGYNRAHVRFLANNGKIPALKRIRKWLFDPQEIEQFLQRKTLETTTK